MMKQVYLAGPVTGTSLKNRSVWRDKLIKDLPPGWKAVDPVKLELKSGRDPEGIVQTDLRAIESCDALLALADPPSWGTAMEIFYAHGLGIPVISWRPSSIVPLSPWLVYHSSTIQFDRTLALQYLEGL